MKEAERQPSPGSPTKSLSQRAIRGGTWVFSLRIVQQIVSMARLIILGNLLSPSDFGLMGVALLAMSALAVFSQTGFQQAIIQRKKDSADFMNVAWTGLLIRCTIIAGILFFAAPLIAEFFDSPKSINIIRAIALAQFITGLNNIGILQFQKELEFSKEFTYQAVGLLADFLVASIYAIIYKNVWALVWGYCAGAAVRAIFSYILHPYRPKFDFSLDKFREITRFGKWIWSANVLTFSLVQGADIFVGKFLGTLHLGYFQYANRISNMPATEFSHVIAKVMFPAYAKMQDDLPRLKSAFFKSFQFTCLVSLPVSGGIFVMADNFVWLALPPVWLAIIPTVQLLALYGGLKAVGATTGAFFIAIGRPQVSTYIKIGQLMLLASLIYPLAKSHGIFGVAAAMTAYSLVFNFVAVQRVAHYAEASMVRLMRLFSVPLLATLTMVAVVLYLDNLLFPLMPALVLFFFKIGAGIIIYIVAVRMFDMIFGTKSFGLIKDQARIFLGK